jgi:SAM-dependent methyltransferase
MSLVQHKDRGVRYRQQVANARDYLLPFLAQHLPLRQPLRVMEVGCGEGGVLAPFVETGHEVLGVDLSDYRIGLAREFQQEAVGKGQAAFLAQNVYDPAFVQEWRGKFDLILLKDTLEHVPGQERFIPHLQVFLRPGGAIFFGFPPWQMPFGGHQQTCRSRLLALLPWIHLLPRGLYGGLLRAFREPEAVVQELLELQETGISTRRFERIVAGLGWQTLARELYLINPIYAYKFGIRPRRQGRLLAALPSLRDFFTTAAWYLVRP